MQTVVCEIQKLVNIFGEIRREIETGKMINLSWELAYEPKTKKQLGFMFGLIVKSAQTAFKDATGNDYDVNQVKHILYSECGVLEFISYRHITYHWKRRISEMTKEQMAEFITKCLDWCDDYNIVLPPEARFLWINSLEPPFIKEAGVLKLPIKSPEYLSHLRSSYCLICGAKASEAHHVHIDSGLGSTIEDWKAVPLCSECHRAEAHITTVELKEKTKYLPWYLGEITLLKLMYDRWQNHL